MFQRYPVYQPIYQPITNYDLMNKKTNYKKFFMILFIISITSIGTIIHYLYMLEKSKKNLLETDAKYVILNFPLNPINNEITYSEYPSSFYDYKLELKKKLMERFRDKKNLEIKTSKELTDDLNKNILNCDHKITGDLAFCLNDNEIPKETWIPGENFDDYFKAMSLSLFNGKWKECPKNIDDFFIVHYGNIIGSQLERANTLELDDNIDSFKLPIYSLLKPKNDHY